MKKQFFLFIIFATSIANSQQTKLITGKIFINNKAITDVHIINKNNNKGTISKDYGWFEIPVNKGDILKFTHVNYLQKEIRINDFILKERKLNINLKEKVHTLDEITISNPNTFLYEDAQLMPPPIVNAKTLKLPYANAIVKKDDAIFKFNSGGVVSLDNLINALNGNNRRKKQLQKITLEDRKLAKIRKQFSDDFFITDLKIKQENINAFLNYCFKNNIIDFFDRNEKIKLMHILIQQSRTFEQKNDIKLVLTQKKNPFYKSLNNLKEK